LGFSKLISIFRVEIGRNGPRILGVKLKLQQLINTIELASNLIFCRIFIYVMFFKLPFYNR
jgi:hypothetical protein